MDQVIVIGGGIVGLSSAYFLQQEGFAVTVLEQGDFRDNCSHGNAGYICPSHIIPLASPGKVWQGIKWMFNPQSPFYIHPSLDRDLWEWGIHFIRNATAENVENGAAPLRDLSLLSQKEYRTWSNSPEFDFTLHEQGLLEIFRTEKARNQAESLVHRGQNLGLDMVMLNQEELNALEPETRINATGAIHFKCDAHVYPNKVMDALLRVVAQNGVQLEPHQEVTQIQHSHGGIRRVVTNKSTFEADYVVLAAGSWSKQLAESIDISFPLMPGRGYSVTIQGKQFHTNHPILLMERSVALTPVDNSTMRFGGTMEVVPIGTPPRYQRMQGIVNATNEYFPDARMSMPRNKDIWFGYRPVSADGLPYIGRVEKYKNLIVAAGHAMVGMSMGAGTGKLVAELVSEKRPSIDIEPFAVERF